MCDFENFLKPIEFVKYLEVFLKQESLFYNVHMPFRDTKPYKYNMTLLEYKGAGYKNSTDPTESSRLVSRFKAIYILTFSYCVA